MKPHVGDQADPMDASDAGCLYSPTPDDPRCSNPATVHLMIRDHTGCHGVVSVAACAEHEPIARRAGVVLREHEHGSVCGWPGAVWLNPPENRCALDDSGVGPGLVMVREMTPA